MSLHVSAHQRFGILRMVLLLSSSCGGGRRTVEELSPGGFGLRHVM